MLHDGLPLALTSEECQEETDVPTYQYQCTACEEGLEVVQKFTDDALTECPSCAGRLKKVFSAVGIVFKGSGFYRNDSRSSASSKQEPRAGSADAPAKKAEGAGSKESAGSSSGGSGSAGSSGSGNSPGSTKPAASTASAA
jgi:putative FmdB family regulatory protein